MIQELIEKVYLPLFPNVAKETTRDSEGKFISGPVLLKTESGQGRFSLSWENLKFREGMTEKGVLMVLGLPNSTSCTQEQDQLHQDFKQCLRTKRNTIYQHRLNKRLGLITSLVLELGATEVEAEKKNIEQRLAVARKMTKLTNDDLPMIVNGNDVDYIENRPFDYCFTKEKIKNCFARVGNVPFTRKAVETPNIQHEMNEKDEKAEDISLLSHQYETSQNVLREMGFTVEGVFDAKIDTALVIRRRAKEEDQNDELVAQKKGFSDSDIYTNIGTMCVTSEAVLKAQRRQMELYARELEDKDRKRRLAERKNLAMQTE